VSIALGIPKTRSSIVPSTSGVKNGLPVTMSTMKNHTAITVAPITPAMIPSLINPCRPLISAPVPGALRKLAPTQRLLHLYAVPHLVRTSTGRAP
jgi:hypothetical protein